MDDDERTKVEEVNQLSHLVDTFLQPPSADRYAGRDGHLQILELELP